MAEFTFKSGIKTLDIKNESGEVVKTFSIDVGNKEQTKRWIKEINKIQSVDQKFSEDEKAIDELEVIEKDVVGAILGGEAWEELWGICGSNVFSMLAFVQYLSKFLNEELQNIYKGYV